MRTQKKRTEGKPRGAALVFGLLMSLIAMSYIFLSLNLAIASDKDANTKKYHVRAQYLAVGAIENAKKDIQTAIANWDTPELDTVVSTTVDGSSVQYVITQPTSQWTVTQPSGIQTIINQYQVDAIATVQGYTASAHRILNAEATPIFQFAVFYTNDLEILPGANMTLGGRVHSNANIHLGSGATLTVNTNYLRSVGNIFRNRKDNPSLSEGTVRIRKWVADPFNGSEPVTYVNMNSKPQMDALGVTTTSGYDGNFTTGFDSNGDGDFTDAADWLPWAPGALAYWSEQSGYTGGAGNTVLTSDHGITEAVTPQIGSIRMFEETGDGTGGDYSWNSGTSTYTAVTPGTGTHSRGFYHDEAGLKIIQKPDGTFEVKNGSDAAVSLPVGTVTSTTMYDARQANGGAGTIPVVEIDINLLNSSGYFPTNGLLYAARYGEGTGTSAGGIRLKNGSTLANKLTVVSEDPIFIKGDYNTVNKKGAAVIGDAINLLSNSWNNSKTHTSGLPTASATTYNVAMISGNQNTSGSSYNGGLENLPRFHENWSGKNCTISGSFVNTWLSQFATGAWVYGGNRYTAPNRIWNYDTSFNNVANLPPFTPMAVTAVDVASW